MKPMNLPDPFNRERLPVFARLIFNGCGQAVTAALTARIVKAIFDQLLNTAETSIAWPAVALLTLAISGAWLRLDERTTAERLGQDYVYDVRNGLFKRLSQIAPRVLQKRSRGGIMLRFVGDLTALRQWVSLGLARLLVATVTAVGAILALVFINPVLGAAVGVVLLGGGVATIALGHPLREAVREARRRRAFLAANVNEKIASMAVVQAFGQSLRERKRIERQSQRLKYAMISRARVTGMSRALAEGTAAIAVAVALVVGSILTARGQATPGSVAAAMSVVGFLLPPLRDLGRVHEYWHGAHVSRRKIVEFLNMPSLVTSIPNAVALQKGGGELQFDDVCVDQALDGITGTIDPGQCVALVGANGAGKSTLLSLVIRLVDPDRGRVFIDGQDVSKVSLSSLRRTVAMVSPDLPLLRGTIEKNLKYRWQRAPDSEIDRVIELCGLKPLLAQLPQGMQTRLTEGGLNLSVGQRQRIAIARALVGSPRILLLDEADANLDPVAAAQLDQILQRYQGTILTVTHRIERLATVDEVWHLGDGKLLESGPYQKLMQKNGWTAQLFQSAPQAVGEVMA